MKRNILRVPVVVFDSILYVRSMLTKRSIIAILSVAVLLTGAGCVSTIPTPNADDQPSVIQPENSGTSTVVSELPGVPVPIDSGTSISGSNGVEDTIKVSPPRPRGEDRDENENEMELSDDDGGTVAPPVATPPVRVTPVPSPTPVPAPTPTVLGAPSYTMAQVAAANSASKCWSVVNGEVYDLTSWIKMHPGGAGAILSLCGIDGTQAYNAMHGGKSRPANELSSLKIGILK